MKQAQYDYDVIYLGSGHATDGAGALAKKGFKVAVIEEDLLGGTCPNRGCNAKISLDAPVVLQRSVEAMQGIVQGHLSINWPANMAHKHELIDPIPAVKQAGFDAAGIDVFKGHGTFTDAHTIRVNETVVTTDKVVIATGMRPHRLAIPGAETAHDSTDFLALTEMPKRVAIIGAGYIAMEFATIANAAGAEVTLMMRGNQALRAYHQPFVERVLTDMAQRGVKIIRNAEITAFQDHMVIGENGLAVSTDWILDATGRIPNIETLNLAAIGINTTSHGVTTNDHLQTTVDNIYASGDVLDKKVPKLTPTATFESNYLTHLFTGETDAAIRYPVIPSTVFTSPRLAKAGVTVSEAEKTADRYRIDHQNVLDNWYRHVNQEPFGESITIHDLEDHLVGITEMSDRADEVINSLLPAIEFKMGPTELERLIYLFPSLGHYAKKLI